MRPDVRMSEEPAGTVASSLPAYRLVSVLARSAMSVVYLADEPALRRRVALKVLAPGVAQDPAFRSRFAREVEIAAALDHPNVIPIHAAGEAGGLLYLTMRFVEGSDLAQIARRGPMSLDETVRIVGQVADALDAAHRAGLVHRDVKPGNVLLDARTGHAYLCDFGIATHAAAAGAVTRTGTDLTQAGAFLGTIDYVAPEQVQGWPVDGRADVYALGAMIFRCLAGSTPFAGGGPAVLWSHVNAPRPSLVERRPDLPMRLDTVLARAMAIDPRERHPTCRALVADVAAAAAGTPQTTPSPPRRRRGRLVAAAVLAVAGLVAAAVLLVPRGIGAADQERVPAALRDSCEPAADTMGATDTVQCRDPSGQDVTVAFYDTADAADRAYDEAVAGAGDVRTSGDCAVASGAEHRYPGVGEAVGRVLCHKVGSTARLLWTDRSARIVATAERGDGNDLELYRAWERWVAVPAYPAAPEQELLDLLEERDCRRGEASSLDGRAGAVAVVDCRPVESEVRTVRYHLFSDGDALRRSYENTVAMAGQAPGATSCLDDPPAFGETVYDVRNTLLGRVLCRPTGSGEAELTWTADALLVLGQALGPEFEGLRNWWFDHRGPSFPQLVEAVNAQSDPPFPTAAEQAILDRIPAASRVDCMRPAESQVRTNVGDADVDVVGCGTDTGPPIVFFYQFADAAELAGAYGGPADTPVDCTTLPPDFAGESAYTRPDGSAGRLRCGINDAGRSFLVWTDDARTVMGVAFGPDPEQIIRWWQAEAGLS